mmetsp:Transcript_96754/g.273360  ORF Transcript_96754/g.273360 Transcript_96754/m.273360 type:complete len:647 (+) Transcript_96754:49-1989(+)
MRRRLAVTSVAVVIFARWWQKRQTILPASTRSLPERVQIFLESHNLTERIDADLAALAGSGMTRPGQQATAPKQKRHPVVMVPGITSCGLEVWKAHPCFGDAFFRRRIWGEVSMAEAILTNWTCWLHHLSLDPATGVDHEGVRVRAAKGLRSADYFVGGFWLWAKIIENLADIGYDEDDLLLACYDWRLAFPLLEKRDKYFTGLRLDIEKAVFKAGGEKVVVIGHSMGSNVFLYFMNWVEREAPGWVDRYVASFVNVAGPLLGAMGPLAAFLSGEMDATAALGPLSDYIEALALTFDQMRDIYWSFGGLGALLPSGGSAVWGSSTAGWTDTPADVVKFEPDFADARSLEALYKNIVGKKDTPLRGYPSWTSYEHGLLHPRGGGGLEADDPRRFANPLASALPAAPNLKIFCFYGTGLQTERAYKYVLRQVRWAWADREYMPESKALFWSRSKAVGSTITDLQRYSASRDAGRPVRIDAGDPPLNFSNVSEAIAGLRALLQGPDHPEKWMRIATNHHSNETDDPWDNGVADGLYAYGVVKTDGDSTVPLVSLGYMCKYGWRDFTEFNPANVSVWTKEFKHDPASLLSDPRGGPATAKHVEIIGNSELIANVLKIAAGQTSDLEEDRIYSNITSIGPIISERVRNALS